MNAFYDSATSKSYSFPDDCAKCGALQVIGIVGNPTIAGDVREELHPAVFFPFTVPIIGPTNMVYELRTAGDPFNYASAVREVVRRRRRGRDAGGGTAALSTAERRMAERICLAAIRR